MSIERAPMGTLTDPVLRAAWDQRAVAAPGGDMHQGSAFAADRARRSIRTLPLYVDGAPLLVCIRSLPLLGLSVASISRGPAISADASDAERASTPGRLQRVGEWLHKEEGVVELRVDPWLPASDALEAEWLRVGFSPCDESFFSKNAMWIRATARPGVTEEETFSLLGSSKRNQVNAARRSEIQVVRLHPDRDSVALKEAASLVNETAVRREFSQINPEQTLLTWSDLMRAGQMEVWVARDAQGVAIAVETALRHGERLTSHHAGSREVGPATPAGAGALLRWTLIEAARQEGRIADLGGADVAGYREIPQPGEKMYGLYDHKRAFGAEWVAMSGAHRVVLDPRRYALRSAVRRLLRVGR